MGEVDLGEIKKHWVERQFSKDDLRNLLAEVDHLRARNALLEQVAETGLAYHRAYFAGPGKDGCTDPYNSGPHDDHDCVVSLRARHHVALDALDQRTTATASQPVPVNETIPTPEFNAWWEPIEPAIYPHVRWAAWLAWQEAKRRYGTHVVVPASTPLPMMVEIGAEGDRFRLHKRVDTCVEQGCQVATEDEVSGWHIKGSTK